MVKKFKAQSTVFAILIVALVGVAAFNLSGALGPNNYSLSGNQVSFSAYQVAKPSGCTDVGADDYTVYSIDRSVWEDRNRLYENKPPCKLQKTGAEAYKCNVLQAVNS